MSDILQPPVTADLVIAEARRFIDTKVRHGGREHGVEVDCVGLVTLAGVNTGAMERPDIDSLMAGGNYGLLPNPKHLTEALQRYLLPVAKGEQRPADIVRFELAVGGGGMHLGILAQFQGRLTVIHADGKHRKVVEVTYSGMWERLTLDFWRFPGLA
jgi:cell wall-associated NlpC family hydrolase